MVVGMKRQIKIFEDMRKDKIGKTKAIATFITDKAKISTISFPLFFCINITFLCCFAAVEVYYFHYTSSFPLFILLCLIQMQTNGTLDPTKYNVRQKVPLDLNGIPIIDWPFIHLSRFQSVIWNGWKGKENVATINRCCIISVCVSYWTHTKT